MSLYGSVPHQLISIIYNWLSDLAIFLTRESEYFAEIFDFLKQKSQYLKLYLVVIKLPNN